MKVRISWKLLNSMQNYPDIRAKLHWKVSNRSCSISDILFVIYGLLAIQVIEVNRICHFVYGESISFIARSLKISPLLLGHVKTEQEPAYPRRFTHNKTGFIQTVINSMTEILCHITLKKWRMGNAYLMVYRTKVINALIVYGALSGSGKQNKIELTRSNKHLFLWNLTWRCLSVWLEYRNGVDFSILLLWYLTDKRIISNA